MQKILGILAVVGLMGVAGTAMADEPYCREYQKNVTIGGVVQRSYGTACMQPDGSWQVDGQQVQGPSDLEVAQAPLPAAVVEDVQPVYVQQQVVYRDPVYVERPYPYYAPVGISLAWGGSWGHGWHGGGWHGGGWHGGGWHGGGGGWHHGH